MMMKPRLLVIPAACVLAFAAGFASDPFSRPQPVEKAAAAPRRPAPAGEAATGDAVDARSFEAILATDAERLFRDLARNPSLDLSDAELALAASHLDLTTEETQRRLNAIASLPLRKRLWAACVRASYGRLPLDQLIGIAWKARITGEPRPQFAPIFDAIEAAGNVREFFAGDPGRQLLTDYLKRINFRGASLIEALAVVPPGLAFAQERERLIGGQFSGPRNVDDFAAALKIDAAHGGLPEAWDRLATTVWSHSDETERERLLDEIAPLPVRQRDRLLRGIAEIVEPADVQNLTTVLGMLGSYSAQREASNGWINRSGPEQKQALIETLQAQPDSARFERLLKFFQFGERGEREGSGE